MFVGQTRLLRYASRAANGQVTQIVPPTETARFDGLVPDVSTAMSYIPPQQRPAADQWGGYDLIHDGRFVYLTTIAGTLDAAPNLLVVFYDVWPDEATRLANPTSPHYRNTHSMLLDANLAASELRARVRAIIEATVIRHTLEGKIRDHRHPGLVASQSDPSGVINKAQPLNNTVQAVTPPASSAPLFTMVPK